MPSSLISPAALLWKSITCATSLLAYRASGNNSTPPACPSTCTLPPPAPTVWTQRCLQHPDCSDSVDLQKKVAAFWRRYGSDCRQPAFCDRLQSVVRREEKDLETYAHYFQTFSPDAQLRAPLLPLHGIVSTRFLTPYLRVPQELAQRFVSALQRAGEEHEVAILAFDPGAPEKIRLLTRDMLLAHAQHDSNASLLVVEEEWPFGRMEEMDPDGLPDALHGRWFGLEDPLTLSVVHVYELLKNLGSESTEQILMERFVYLLPSQPSMVARLRETGERLLASGAGQAAAFCAVASADSADPLGLQAQWKKLRLGDKQLLLRIFLGLAGRELPPGSPVRATVEDFLRAPSAHHMRQFQSLAMGVHRAQTWAANLRTLRASRPDRPVVALVGAPYANLLRLELDRQAEANADTPAAEQVTAGHSELR